MSLSYDTTLKAERMEERLMREPFHEARNLMLRYFKDRLKEHLDPAHSKGRTVESVRSDLARIQKDNPAREAMSKVTPIKSRQSARDIKDIEKSGLKKAKAIKASIGGRGAVSLSQARTLAKGAAEKAGKEAGKQVAMTAAKEAAKTAIGTAAKTNPVTLAVDAAAKAATVAARAVKEAAKDSRTER